MAFRTDTTTVDKGLLTVVSNNGYRRGDAASLRRCSRWTSSRKLNFRITSTCAACGPPMRWTSALHDDALMVGVGTVSILHGKGTGALKEEIRRYLRTVPEIASAVDEHADRGGAGITIVTFDLS